MKKNFKLNHDGDTRKEVLKNVPSESKDMLTALYVMIGTLVSDDVKGETKREKRERLGFAKGLLTTSLLLSGKKCDMPNSVSGMLEVVLTAAKNEDALKDFATFVVANVIKPSQKVKSKTRVEVLKIDDLPEDIRDAVMDVIKSKNE